MPTLDQSPGELIEESILLEDVGDGLSFVQGQMRYVAGRFSFVDSAGEYDPRTGGTSAPHEQRDTLTHNISESAFFEALPATGLKSSLTWWTDQSKSLKIRDIILTRAEGRVSMIVETQYDAIGSPVVGQTLTRTIVRVGGRIVSMTLVEV